MAKLLGVVVAMSLSLVSASAFADPPPPGAVTVLKTTTIVGKRQLPSVVIEISRLSAAHEAGAAHDALHLSLVPHAAGAASSTRADTSAL